MNSNPTTMAQDYIPTIRSNRPMAMAGAIVQNEFHHRRNVYSKTLTSDVSKSRRDSGTRKRTIVSSSHSKSGTTKEHQYKQCSCRRS